MKENNYDIKFSGHSLSRMFERDISVDDVKQVVFKGEIVEDYESDKPYPSTLKLFFIENRPLHVVSSVDETNKIIYIITAYYPDKKIWDLNFMTRRK